MEYVLLNKTIVSAEEQGLSLHNRAFLYGDGIFETLIVKDGKICYLEDHYKRLCQGLLAYSIKLPTFLTVNFLRNKIAELASLNNAESSYRVRLTVWRAEGGLYTPVSNGAELLMSLSNFFPHPVSKNQVFIFEDIRKQWSTISAFKNINSAASVLASIAKIKRQADDMILLDQDNYISECTASNIFMIKDNELYTPPLECGCVDGILRRQILLLCKNADITIHSEKISRHALEAMEFVFTSNVAGTVAIRKVEKFQFAQQHPLFDKINELLKSHQTATGALI